MTLDTRIRLVDPIPPLEAFHAMAALLGADSNTFQWEHDLPGTHQRGNHSQGIIHALPFQGLPAWLWVYYLPEAPLPCVCRLYPDDSMEGHQHDPLGQIDVTIDTPYAYNENGENCSTLHDRLIREYGMWLESRQVDWWWQDEFDGSWHHRLDDGHTLAGRWEK